MKGEEMKGEWSRIVISLSMLQFTRRGKVQLLSVQRRLLWLCGEINLLVWFSDSLASM